jgi:hypothetical protein
MSKKIRSHGIIRVHDDCGGALSPGRRSGPPAGRRPEGISLGGRLMGAPGVRIGDR